MAPSVFLWYKTGFVHVTATAVAVEAPLTRAVHWYIESPSLANAGGVVFQLESLSVRVEVVKLYVEPLGLVGELPLLACTSE